MSGATQALVATLAIVFVLVLMWAMVPTEQTLAFTFPNVVMLRGFGSEAIEPISFDNNTLDTVEAAEASYFNGVYQFDPMFYHKTLDRFIPWEDRDKASIWECTLGCRAMNTSDSEVRLALVHT